MTNTDTRALDPGADEPQRPTLRAGRDTADDPPPLTIGLLAPPWLPVPPTGYGGTEAAIDVLARGLRAMGHEVVLFAAEESTCPVTRRSSGPALPRHRLGSGSLEVRAVAAGHAALRHCDVIHDHTLLGPLYAAARTRAGRGGPPVLATAHGLLDGDDAELYRAVADRVPIIAISHRQAAVSPGPVFAVIHHGLDVSSIPPGPGDGGYVAFVGRMTPEKGVERAIRIARAAGLRLCIAAKCSDPQERSYAREVIGPLLGPDIEDLGELSHAEKYALLRGASALLNPISWHEPFGMVMIEALACGTPVVASPLGAAPEIVRHGVNGYLCAGDGEFVDALARCAALSRSACRDDAARRFSMARVARDHAGAYRRLLACEPQGLVRRRR